jgi:hypothetical protein
VIVKLSKADRFNWWLSLWAFIGALVVFVPLAIRQDDDLYLFYSFIVVLIVSLLGCIFLLVAASRKRLQRALSILAMLATYWAASALLAWNHFTIRTSGRWFLDSQNYKSMAIAQSSPPNVELKHVEWDAWGYPGAGNTTVFLVFDPTDSLSVALRSHHSGKFSGIPCEVPLVRRMESYWYIVLFYTDESWGRCKEVSPSTNNLVSTPD